MNPHLIERLAHERIQERLRRADVDGRLYAAGRRGVRRPFWHVPSLGSLLRDRRRHDACSTSASCHA